ncbi:MAG: DUF2183 domain-containing protein [Pirellulaceae bacterium]|nr:DUF2183 domain-containing protein [Pirellulaceae bacterium]
MKPTSEQKSQLVAFPGTGYQIEPGRWRVQVAGVLQHPYLPNLRKRMLLKILANILGTTESELLSPSCFGRIAPFVCDGARGQPIMIQLGDQQMLLPRRTRSNGHFLQTLHIPDSLLRSHLNENVEGGRLKISFASPSTDGSLVDSVLHLLPQSGLSVISDIDDTIKESDINDRRELLANTFVRPFRTVPGMSQVYREWSDSGATFHYVSSSPWQLFVPLEDMLSQHAFPEGPIHLRYFRLRNQLLQRMVRIKRSGKITTLRRVVQGMPQRRFILIGDSGEKDLELYRNLANKFKDQVLAVFIRNLPDRPVPIEKIQRFQHQLPKVPCHAFSTPEELAALGGPIVTEFQTREIRRKGRIASQSD